MLDAFDGMVSAVASCSGLVVTASGVDEFALRLWSPSTWKPVQSMVAHKGVIHAVVECADAIVAASADASISVRPRTACGCVVVVVARAHTLTHSLTHLATHEYVTLMLRKLHFQRMLQGLSAFPLARNVCLMPAISLLHFLWLARCGPSALLLINQRVS